MAIGLTVGAVRANPIAIGMFTRTKEDILNIRGISFPVSGWRLANEAIKGLNIRED